MKLTFDENRIETEYVISDQNAQLVANAIVSTMRGDVDAALADIRAAQSIKTVIVAYDICHLEHRLRTLEKRPDVVERTNRLHHDMTNAETCFVSEVTEIVRAVTKDVTLNDVARSPAVMLEIDVKSLIADIKAEAALLAMKREPGT